MSFPNASLPFIFVDVAGSSRRGPSRSHFNEEEVDVCQVLVRRLLRRGVQPASVCLITFYKEQHRHLAGFAQETGVALATVDSIQGRERDVTIILTTRTHFTPEAGEFLNDPHRVNVALTRCRHDRRGVAEHGSMGSRRHEQSVTPTGGDNGRCDLGELVSKERFAFLCGV
ncbi:hypothetical protein Q1695_004358 [Nippostrongylus brasiliensis]|nr:hypothetical protein Q1695_004358 [Nippostrongylus brasiliensis]